MGLVTSNAFWNYGLMGSASTLVFALVTIPRLNLRILDEARDSGVMTEDRKLSQRLIRRILFLVDPQRRSWSFGNWMNPVLIKEFRSRRFGRLTWLLRLVAVCAVASMGLTYIAATSVESWSVETIGSLLIVWQMALIVLLSPGLSAGLLASELESGGWTLLRMTPLSSWRIMTGKLLSVAWTMLLILLATLPGYLAMIYVKPVLKQQVVFVVGSLLLASAFTLIVSAAVGSFFRRTTPATMTSYAVLAALTGLPLLIWLGREAPFGVRVVKTALMVDPIASALSYMQAKGFSEYQVVPGNLYFLGGGCILGLLVFWFRTWQLTRPD
jgi:ABC-type transport system involved in multi-copper enzyme maturation permease subunit